ncbi:MAG: hypothetical protein JST00_23725 [Deltaproteobacteria bacterium]|nr:hypothetical protein [Deltaproteobacteria bacterium]
MTASNCGGCASSDDGNGSYPSCCDVGSSGKKKTCRNRKCCLGLDDECASDADCCLNDALKCRDATGGKKKCST